MEENNKANLKDIYLSYTNQASDWTNKRLTLNSIYITLCTTLAGFTVSHFKILGLALSFVGILLSIICFLTILTFKRMNSAKFQVIKDLENKLGIKPYEMEWKFAKAKKYI